MSTPDLLGGCACGAVRFRATGAPRFAFICQCGDCQKMTGSGHAVQFCHDAARFEVSGSPAEWAREAASGHVVTKYFCGTCGNPLYGHTSRAPDIVMALAGALDDPGQVTPDRMFFHEDAQPWDTASVPGAPERKED